MARSIRSSVLETRATRLRLGVARKPIFVKIGPSVGLGYRRNRTAGTWVVWVGDGQGGNWTRAIGAADDFDEADGSTYLNFWQAQEKARALARAGRGVESALRRPSTVEEALDSYETDLKSRGADTGNVNRVRAHLSAGLREKAVGLLISRELRGWRDGLAKAQTRTAKGVRRTGEESPNGERRSFAAATINRTCAAFKAALYLAAEHDDGIANHRAWETGLASIPDAEQSRNVILSESTVRRLIQEARKQSPAFGLLVEAAAFTGARVSQLARIEVQNLQADRAEPRLMMPTSRKGKGTKKVLRRPVPISMGLAERLQTLVADRPSTVPLFVKPSGQPSKEVGPFSAVCPLGPGGPRRSQEDPKKATMYALRHSTIVRQLLAGVPIRVVAVNHDTSIAMLERTHSRHIGDFADAVAHGGLLDMSEPSTDTLPVADPRTHSAVIQSP